MRRRRNGAFRDSGAEEPRAVEVSTCWLCSRELGRRTEWHHPVPKSRGGRTTVPLHPICHRTIHANFTNVELARAGEEVGKLHENPAVTRFLAWIADKPADFHARTATRRT